MSESWKPIKGFEGYYEVSNLGKIRSIKRQITYKNGAKHWVKPKTLKPILDTYGYGRYTLYKNGHAKQALAHRLVAETFVPNPDGFPDINHKNENRLDNRASNLEWCTKKYNNNFGNHNKHLSTAKEKAIYQLDSSGKIIKQWPAIQSAVKALGLSSNAHSNISACLHGRISNAYGYKWRFAENNPE